MSKFERNQRLECSKLTRFYQVKHFLLFRGWHISDFGISFEKKIIYCIVFYGFDLYPTGLEGFRSGEKSESFIFYDLQFQEIGIKKSFKLSWVIARILNTVVLILNHDRYTTIVH